MQQDEPTVPIRGWPPPDASAAPPDAYVTADPFARGTAPTWPAAREPYERQSMPRRDPGRSVSATAFAISLAANVVLVFALVAVVTFMVTHASNFQLGGGSGQPMSGAQSTPTATATPSPSPTAEALGWLQIAPSSVQLGCGDGQQTQPVMLQNTGAASVRWQATFSLPADQAGVAMSPQHGTLAAGATVQIQLQNTTRASDTQGAAGLQGEITFTARSSEAGTPATLSYATLGCS